MSDVPSDGGVFFNGLPIATRLESVHAKVNDKHRPQGRSFGKEVTFRLPRLTEEWQVVVTNKHRDLLRKEFGEYRETMLETQLQQYRQKMLEHFELERAMSVAYLLKPLSLSVLAVDKIYRSTKSDVAGHVPLHKVWHLFAAIKYS